MSSPASPCRLSARALLVLVAGIGFGCARSAPPPAPTEDVAAVAAEAPDVLRRDVVLLRSTDFVERTRAAERLVAAGEAAIPSLGDAGEGATAAPGAAGVSTTAPVLRAILDDLPDEALQRHLDAPWPVVRRVVVEEVGTREKWSAVPALIARMDDADAHVRGAAASSLRRLTNRFFGFDARADPRVRERAARRWREWWSVEGRVRAEQAGDRQSSG